MDTGDIAQEIQRLSGISEVAKVTTFDGYLEGVGGVEIKIRDRGEGHKYRFGVSARTQDLAEERTAAGNPESDLRMAFAAVHWGDLKR